MSEEIKNVQKTRRSAIKTAAQVAVTAPAVGLLLSASTKSASAALTYATSKTGDDHFVKTVYYDDGGLAHGGDNQGTVVLISGDDTF
jgi:hypothetical protein